MKSDQVLNNIRISKLFSHQELIGAVQNLEKDIIVDPSIKLVVIDSIAALFRHSFSDIPQRSKLLAGMAQTLRKIAECYNVTVKKITMFAEIIIYSKLNATILDCHYKPNDHQNYQ